MVVVAPLYTSARVATNTRAIGLGCIWVRALGLRVIGLQLGWTTIGLAARLSGMEAVTQRGHKTTLASQAGCEPDTYLAGHVCVGKLPIVRGTARHPQGMTPSVSENTPGSVHAPPPPCHRAPRLVFGHLAKSYITSFTVQNVHNLKNINHRYRHRGGSLSI